MAFGTAMRDWKSQQAEAVPTIEMAECPIQNETTRASNARVVTKS